MSQENMKVTTHWSFRQRVPQLKKLQNNKKYYTKRRITTLTIIRYQYDRLII